MTTKKKTTRHRPGPDQPGTTVVVSSPDDPVYTAITDPNLPARSTQHPGGGEMVTKQSDRLGRDANEIMARWTRTGTVPQAGQTPRYGDFTGVQDFHHALCRIREAELQFGELDSEIRRYCGNDVGEFLDLAYNPARREELESLGMEPEWVGENPPTPREPSSAGQADPSEPPKGGEDA